ncbi:MAG: hypothetical protein SOT46_03270 [Treponema sp.]|nr:hypothetical protein [Treponema sp.]
MKKKSALFYIFITISLSLFAAPPPGGAPNGGKGPGGGNPGGNGIPSGRPNSPSGGGRPDSHNSRPAPPPQSGSMGNAIPSKNPPSQVMNYRGMRTAAVSAPLKVLNTSVSTGKDNNLQLEIKFNQTVNPLSITRKSILINEEPAANSVKITFNKKGDLMILSFDADSISRSELENFSVKLLSVETYDGKYIKELEIK